MHETPSDREQARLAALERYDVLDTPPEEAFDRVTRLIRVIFDVPIATLTLVDGHRLWFKSREGLPVIEAPRAKTMCETVVTAGTSLVLPDAADDERFRNTIEASADPKFRFYAGVPLRTPDGHVIGVLCAADTEPRQMPPERIRALYDLAQIAMRELELRSLAMVDTVTGAMSRRAFKEEAERMVSLARRHNADLSCITLDLDHLRTINGALGLSNLDDLLRETAEACRVTLRKSDIFGRVGGKQFSILLPHASREKAFLVAEKLRLAISKLSAATERGGEVKVTASLGIAMLDRSMGSAEQLFARAAEALEDAKKDGRNRCVAALDRSETAPATLQRVLKAGRIVLNGGFSTIDCTVRGLSDSGASIDVASTAGIPDRFDLVIGTDRVAHPSQVVSKRERRIDLRFVA